MRQTTTTDRPKKKPQTEPRRQDEDREAAGIGDDDLTDDELDELEGDEDVDDEADEDDM